MPTKKEDWNVTDISRKTAEYSDRIEMLTFKASYKGGAPEQLVDVPFPRGTTHADLLLWCAEDTVEIDSTTQAPVAKGPIVFRGGRITEKMRAEHGLQPSK